MNTLTGVLPLALVLVVVAGLLWWLLDQGSGAAAWLVAAVLFAHGWVHLVFLLPTQHGGAEDNLLDMSASWLVGQGTSVELVRSVGAVLAAAALLTFLAAALATLGWLVRRPGGQAAWLPGVVGSTLLLGVVFAPMLLLGFLINAVWCCWWHAGHRTPRRHRRARPRPAPADYRTTGRTTRRGPQPGRATRRHRPAA